MSELFPVGMIGAIVLASWITLSWVLGPLDRAARNRRYPIQFGLADLLCVFVLVQLPIGILHWWLQGERHEMVVSLDVLLGGTVVVLWWICVRTLSRAGIHVVWQRCIVLTLVMPGAYVGTFALVALPFAAVDLFRDHDFVTGGRLLLVEVVLVCILYGFSLFTRAIAASAKEERSNIEETGEEC